MSLGIWIGIIVLTTIIITFLAGLPPRLGQATASILRWATRLIRGLEWLSNQGRRLRGWKDRLIQPIVRWIPLSADGQTWLRGIILTSVNTAIASGYWSSWLLWPYSLGWLLDLTDGPTAKLRGPSKYGRWLDPTIDMVCICYSAVVLIPHYQHAFWPLALITSLFVRTGLFWQYHKRRLAQRLGRPLLDNSIGGQAKTWFIAASFGLLFLADGNQAIITWAEVCLALGLILEVLALIGFTRSIRRQLAALKTS